MSSSAKQVLGGASAPPRTPGVLGEKTSASRAARARGFLDRVGWFAPEFAAGLVAWRSWHAWVNHRQRMIPDFDLYTQGGLGIWPTIPGRALGALGPENFARLSIMAGALAVFIACARSRSPVFAALGLVLSPASLYLAYAGIDPIGLLLFVVAAVGYRTLPIAVAAATTHYALLPYVLLELYRRRPNPVVAGTVLCVLAVPVTVALTMTPYSGLVYGLLDWQILPYSILGVGVGVALGGLLWLFVIPTKRIIAPFLVGGALCGVQTHVQARYLLPAVFLLALEAEGPLPWLAAWRARWATRRLRRGSDPSVEAGFQLLDLVSAGPGCGRGQAEGSCVGFRAWFALRPSHHDHLGVQIRDSIKGDSDGPKLLSESSYERSASPGMQSTAEPVTVGDGVRSRSAASRGSSSTATTTQESRFP